MKKIFKWFLVISLNQDIYCCPRLFNLFFKKANEQKHEIIYSSNFFENNEHQIQQLCEWIGIDKVTFIQNLNKYLEISSKKGKPILMRIPLDEKYEFYVIEPNTIRAATLDDLKFTKSDDVYLNVQGTWFPIFE